MSRIEEAKAILKVLGLPPAQQNDISALTFLALCGVGPTGSWQRSKRQSMTISKGIMRFLREAYDKRYAENTRETFRRQVLHQFVQGGIADYNPDDPGLPTNSPQNHYAISNAALRVARAFGRPRFAAECRRFQKNQPLLCEIYEGTRRRRMVPVRLPDGCTVALSSGKHNELQAAVVESFAPRFSPGARLLYLGDAANKDFVLDVDSFRKIGVSIDAHNKLPDVVLLDETRHWLFLIEAVTSHGPMSPKRVHELQHNFVGCSVGLVFVTAFPDFVEFRKHLRKIAWETEVWIAEIPDHLIHYNGDRFLGPHHEK